MSEAEVWRTNTVRSPLVPPISVSQLASAPVISLKPLPCVATVRLWLACRIAVTVWVCLRASSFAAIVARMRRLDKAAHGAPGSAGSAGRRVSPSHSRAALNPKFT
ncbi:MAG: hypothetical protein ABWZ94_00020 [Methyloceanibacter sp.]